MARNLIRRFGELVMSTIGVLALIYIGNGNRALHLLRQGTALQLRRHPSARDTLSSTIAVGTRTLDEWNKQAKGANGEEADQEDDLENLEQLDHRDVRFFHAVTACLRQSEEPFTSLGQIVDFVKRRVDRGFKTPEVHARLEAYVHLKLLEHDPADPEQYRLAVPIPVWAEDNLEHVERLFKLVGPLSFDLFYQNFVRAPGAELRVHFHNIPESQRELFLEKVKSGYREYIAQLDKLEAELQSEDPTGPRVQQALLFLTGSTGQDFKSHFPEEATDDQS